MAIQVRCSGGHKLNVPDKFAGKKIRCPKCEVIVRIPKVGESPTGDPAASQLTNQAKPAKQKPARRIKTKSAQANQNPAPAESLQNKDESNRLPSAHKKKTTTAKPRSKGNSAPPVSVSREAFVDASEEYNLDDDGLDEGDMIDDTGGYDDDLYGDESYGDDLYTDDSASLPRRRPKSKRPKKSSSKNKRSQTESSSAGKQPVLLGIAAGSLSAIVLLGIIWMVLPSGPSADANAKETIPSPVASADSAAAPLGISSTTETDITTIQTETPSATTQSDVAVPSASDAPVINAKARLREIQLGFALHRECFGMYAAPTGSGKYCSQLSWRVHLLPFVGELDLHNRFHLDEPWDSVHNKALLPEIPPVFRFDSSPLTRVRVASGPDMLFGSGRPASPRDLKDGHAQTIQTYICGASQATEWTRPEEPDFNSDTAAGILNALDGQPLECMMWDARSTTFPGDVSPETLSALLTPAGNELVADATVPENASDETPMPPELGLRIKTIMSQDKRRKQNLDMIGAAMQQYHDIYKRLPLSDSKRLLAPDGTPLLSWRVHVLPLLGQRALHQQFNLDESWDSEHNAALLKEMPDFFRDPSDDADSSDTRVLTLTGPGTAYPSAQGLNMREFGDGSQSTLVAVLAGRDKAVPWTKPADLPFDPAAPIECLGKLDYPGVYCLSGSCSRRVLLKTIPRELLTAAVTPSGGERLPREKNHFGL